MEVVGRGCRSRNVGSPSASARVAPAAANIPRTAAKEASSSFGGPKGSDCLQPNASLSLTPKPTTVFPLPRSPILLTRQPTA